jgi:hypothetical protein
VVTGRTANQILANHDLPAMIIAQVVDHLQGGTDHLCPNAITWQCQQIERHHTSNASAGHTQGGIANRLIPATILA